MDNLKNHFFLGYSALFVLFVITLAVQLPARKHHHFFEDDYLHLENVQEMSRTPMAIFAIERKDSRRHPLYYALLFIEKSIFGGNVLPYFAAHYFVHLLNAILIIQFARKLGASTSASHLAGLLFFGSAAFYNIMIKFTATLELEGLFFFLLATLMWVRFLQGARYAALIAILFQLASLLTYEVAVVFPLLAFVLTLFYEKNTSKRVWIMVRVISPMAAVSFFVFWGLTKDFWHSSAVHLKIAPQPVELLISKVITFGRMFVAPVFERWKSCSGLVAFGDFGLILAVPLYAALISIGGYLAKKNQLVNFFKDIPKPLVPVSVLWILITISLHLPYPGTFVQATRYMLYPAVGVMILAGFFMDRVFSGLLHVLPHKALFLRGVILCYILGINLWTVSFQYNRYQSYLKEHPKEDFTAKVNGLGLRFSVPG